MPVKKKKANGKKIKKEYQDDTNISDSLQNINKLNDNVPRPILPPEIEYWVTLELRLLNWGYMDFKLRVKTTTPLFTIKNHIEKKHGRIMNLKICKDYFSERNEMTNDMTTLEEYGIEGAPFNADEIKCQLYYDYKPCDHDEPILLVSNG